MIFGRHELYLYFETRAYSLHYEKFADGTVKEIEVPYELPAGWEWARLTTANKSILAGGDKPKEISNFQTSQFPVPIFSNGVKNNGLYGWGKKAKIFENSVTISARGTIGHTVVRTIPYIPIVRLISVIPFSKKIDIHFLKYMITYMVPSGEGTSIPQLTVPNIKQFLVAVPPYKEQLRIVNVINKQFRLLKVIDTEQNSLQQLATQLKQKVLDIAMQGKLVPQDPNDEPASVLLEKIRAEKQRLYEEGKIKKKDLVETEIVKDGDNAYYGKLPKTWIKSKLFSVANVIMGQSPKGNNVTSEFSLNAVEFHQGKSDFGEKFLNPSGKYTSQITKEIEIPSIVMSVRAPVGDVNLTRKTIVIGRGLAAIQPYGYSLEYLYHFLLTQKSILEQQATGTTFKAIGGEVLRNLPIALPAEKEQIRIVNLINSVFEVESQLMK